MEHLQQFESFYSDFKAADLARLGNLYGPQILFRDPVHELSGLTALETYFAASQAAVAECRFEFLDRIVSASDTPSLKCCYRWRMHYSHPRLKGGAKMELMGASVLHLQEKIQFHEDFYDMGAMLYEQVPLLGGAVRWLKNRVAGADS
jgi:hypothetical protein